MAPRESTEVEGVQREFMSPMQVADWLGIGRSKVYAILAAPDGIVSYKVGKRRLVRRSDVLAYLKAQHDQSGEVEG